MVREVVEFKYGIFRMFTSPVPSVTDGRGDATDLLIG